MKIIPLAAESFGTRSMAVYAETKDIKIFVDPSSALGPSRYGLPPAPEELDAQAKAKSRIRDLALKCSILTISHYHYDHYDPGESFYEGKTVFAKDINRSINKSQYERGSGFGELFGKKCDLIYADDKTFTFGDTKIAFSSPVPHGPEGTRLGFVLMCTIDDGSFKMMHASDVQGPISKKTADRIIEEAPDLLITDGPPTYFLGYRLSVEDMNAAKANLLRIIDKIGCDVLLDHHLLRDPNHKERFREVYETGAIKSMAEYAGKENELLEAHRNDLWRKYKRAF